MRARVRCNCGWQRELSGFYAGKRIRCPECAAIVEVPGEDARGAYMYPPMIDWPSGRHVKPQGKWVTLNTPRHSQLQGSGKVIPPGRRLTACEHRRKCCRGARGLLLLIPALVLSTMVLSTRHHQAEPKPRAKPMVLHVDVETTPEAPPEAKSQPVGDVPQPERLQPKAKQQTTPARQTDPDAEQEDEF
jgi:hypothetical protein